MRYIDCGPGGGAEVMRVAEAAVPKPRQGELVVRVAYAGVNHHDLLQRAGKRVPPPGDSSILGLEVSGWCAAVGPDCGRWKVGDTLCALTPGGGYAEYCRVPAAHCLPIPTGLGMAQAAALPEACITVWANVFVLGRLAHDERLLVHGGSSGVGIMALQIAHAWGARVAATVGNAAKQAVCRSLGADPVVNYRERDFVTAIKEAIGGVDVVLDVVGGSYTARNLELLDVGGRLVQIATLGGAQVQVDLPTVMRKRLTLTGSTLRPRSVEDKAALCAAIQREVWPMLADGRVRPFVQSVHTFERAAEAHRELERSQHVGKILLRAAGEEAGSATDS
ncbi:MAG TPA: NAD(P)H-quinone oxidoreductase [Nevskiaceae bacterium]